MNLVPFVTIKNDINLISNIFKVTRIMSDQLLPNLNRCLRHPAV